MPALASVTALVLGARPWTSTVFTFTGSVWIAGFFIAVGLVAKRTLPSPPARLDDSTRRRV